MEGACMSGCTQTWTLDGMYGSGMNKTHSHSALITVLFIDDHIVKREITGRKEHTI